MLPGANIGLAFLLAIPFVVVNALLYYYMTQSMARSGGDYVWISRIVSPAIALGFGFLFVYFNATLMGSIANFMVSAILAPGIGSIGLASGDTSLIGSSAYFGTSGAILIFGTLILLTAFVLLLIPLRYSLRINTILWILGMLSVVIYFVAFLTTSHSQFISTYDSYFAPYNATYNGMISSATSSGFSNPGLVTFGIPTLFAVVFVFFILNGFQSGAYYSGELKNSKKAMYTAALIGGVVSAVLLAAAGFIGQQVVGADYLNAVSYVQSSAPSAYTLPISFNSFVIAVLLTHNAVIGGIVVLGLIAWGILLIESIGLACSRVTLAWGFDRALPSKIGYVSGRLHTPVVAVVIYTLIAGVGLVASIYAGVIFAQINYSLFLAVLYAFVGFTALVFPFRRKSIFQLSPIAKYKLGSIPAISILGVVNLIVFGFLIYFALAYPSLSGPTGPTALGVFVGIFILGVIAYYISKAYNKSKGINIDLAFSEIPPE